MHTYIHNTVWMRIYIVIKMLLITDQAVHFQYHIIQPFPHNYILLLTTLSFEKIVTKGEIAHDEQFHLFPQFFQLYLIVINLNFKSRLLQVCCRWNRVKDRMDSIKTLYLISLSPFPHAEASAANKEKLLMMRKCLILPQSIDLCLIIIPTLKEINPYLYLDVLKDV